MPGRKVTAKMPVTDPVRKQRSLPDRAAGTIDPEMSFGDLKAKASYLSEADQVRLDLAYEVAERAHQGVTRLSGEPYIEHPLAVAEILAELHLDPDSLVAALLHDTVEDTDLTSEDIAKDFGAEVAKLVEGVTKLGKIHVHSQEQAQAENIRKMLVAMAEDIRVVLIKLADRLHNMRTIKFHSEDRRRRIARETLDIYAPLAHRLGIWHIKNELEDLAFAQIDPDRFHEIEGQLASKRKEREQFVHDVGEILEKECETSGIHADISGRQKHVYSISEKMRRDDKKLDEIYDLLAIRVVVDDIKDCYNVLGVVHSLWKPIPGRFKDYIAMPKGNGYQSLHTTVVSHSGEPMEIQIRTTEMHETSEFGVAAHWRYKEGGKGKSHKMDERFAWLRLLMEWQKDVTDAESFVDTVKLDVFSDEVFVFSPKGDVIALPSESTPIDFAYRIHTEVGNRCIGAKVSGRMVPLDYKLDNGDIVEVLTSKGAHGPSRDWLNFVKTSSAREKIRSWFKRERREENVTRGRELLEKEFRRVLQTNFANIEEPRLLDLAKEFRFATVDDFVAAVGYGDVSARQAVLKFSAQDSAMPDSKDLLSIPVTTALPTPTGSVRVLGMGNVLTNLAQCCHPLVGDAIKGYITRGKGVSVHKASCTNVVNAVDGDRLVEVEWETGASHLYAVNLKIEAWDRTGLLRDIAAVIAECKVNLAGADVQVYDDRTAVISTTVEVQNLAELSNLMEKLETVRDVHTVTRDGGVPAGR